MAAATSTPWAVCSTRCWRASPPFTGRTAQAVLARHAIDPVPSLRTPRPTVSRALAQVITRALAKVPADRFPTARAFDEALAAAAIAPEGSGDDTPTLAVEARRIAGRRRRWLLIAAAGAVVVIAAAAGLALRFGRKPVALEPGRVMVLPFQNRTGDPTLDALGEVAADYIVSGLRGANEAWSSVGEVVDARSQADGETARKLTRSGARVLATEAGSGSIVLGAYDRAPGDSVQFQSEVLDTRTGQALRLIGPVSAPIGAPLAALTGVRTRVMAAVNSMLDLSFSEETSLPETHEALKEYKAGDDALMHCQGDESCEAQGIAHMRRAAAIDSNFTLPLTTLAFNFMWSNCGLVDSIAAELAPRIQRLPAETPPSSSSPRSSVAEICRPRSTGLEAETRIVRAARYGGLEGNALPQLQSSPRSYPHSGVARSESRASAGSDTAPAPGRVSPSGPVRQRPGIHRPDATESREHKHGPATSVPGGGGCLARRTRAADRRDEGDGPDGPPAGR